MDAAGTNYRQPLRPRPGSPLAKVQPPLSLSRSSRSCPMHCNAAHPIKTQMNPPARARVRYVQKVKLKGKFAKRFQVGSKVGTDCQCEFSQLGRGVFGICLPRDSYFEFGSLGTHWPSGLPHRHLPPPSIRVSSRTASE